MITRLLVRAWEYLSHNPLVIECARATIIAVVPTTAAIWAGKKTRRHATTLRAQSQEEHDENYGLGLETTRKIDEIHKQLNGNGRDH